MQKPENIVDIELIKLLCILSILNELQTESVAKEIKKLSIYNVLD